MCYYLCWQHGNGAFSFQMLKKVFFTFLQHGGVFLQHGCEFTNIQDFPLHSYCNYIINTLCIAIYFVVIVMVCIWSIWTSHSSWLFGCMGTSECCILYNAYFFESFMSCIESDLHLWFLGVIKYLLWICVVYELDFILIFGSFRLQ